MEAMETNMEDTSKMLFEEFLSTCGHDKSSEMQRILHKTRCYYFKTKPEYINSEEFQNLVSLKTREIIRDPRRIYVYIKDVVDEMRSRKKMRTNLLEGPPNKKLKLSDSADDKQEEETSENIVKEEDGEKIDIEAIGDRAESRYKERKVRKLCRALKRVNAVIKKLEEKEVDFDEENDSTYIKLERYKDRCCKIYQKLCELTGDANITKMSQRIGFSGTDSQEINRCIEKFVNRTGQFPDFHDILKLVKSVEADKNMKPEAMRRTAERAFISVGQQLQKKRQCESWNSLAVFLKDEADPAEENPELESVLQKNSEENAGRIQKVIDSFAEKQASDNLEAEEVPEEEASKSGGSGEEDEAEEDEEEEDEEEKNYVDKVLEGDKDVCLGDDVEMIQEDESNTSDDEGGERDGGSDVEQSSNSYSNEPYLDDDNSGSEDHQLSLSDYNLTPRKRNLGPVSPPVLGEVINDIDFTSSVTVKDDTISSVLADDSSHQVESKDDSSKEKDDQQTVCVDNLSKNESEAELSVPSSTEKPDKSEKDSEILQPSENVSVSDKKSDVLEDSKEKNFDSENPKSSEPTSSQEINVITDVENSPSEEISIITEVENSPSEKVVKNGYQSSKDSSTTKPESTASSSGSVTSESRQDSVSPSILEPIVETEEFSESDTSKNENKNDKFVVTKIEVESSGKGSTSVRKKLSNQNVKPSPQFSSVITSRKFSSECVDVITLE